jgi:DNA-binding response OmpR family regulator
MEYNGSGSPHRVGGEREIVLAPYTILLVEGRKRAAERLSPILNDQGYNVITARTRREALTTVQATPPAVIVLDSPSLRFDNQRFCSALRETVPEIPILMLLPEGEEIDRRVGARGYLRYPFSAKKLLNRIARLLPVPDDEVLRAGRVTLNLKQRCVLCGERETHLTPKQAHLLEIFMRHPGEILSRALLMKQVWDTDYLGDLRTLEVHIHWVRKAIGDDPASPVRLRTIRRVGYRFEVSEKK